MNNCPWCEKVQCGCVRYCEEIAGLTAENKRLRGALQSLVAYGDDRSQINEQCMAPLFAVIQQAKQALADDGVSK